MGRDLEPDVDRTPAMSGGSHGTGPVPSGQDDPAIRPTNDRRRDAGGHSMRPRRTGFIVASSVIVVTGLVIVVVMGSRFGSDPNQSPSAVINQLAPTMELPLLTGQGSLSLDDFRGDVVVVNFWASWCTACRNEHDDLLTAEALYDSRGVHFVGISFEDRTEDAMAMLDELGWGTGYHFVVDPDHQAAFSFGIRGIPETFFINPSGVIVNRIFGESTFAMLSEALDHVLATPPAEANPATTTDGS